MNSAVSTHRTRKINQLMLRDDYAVIVINSKRHGLIECLLDIDDLPELTQHCWYAKWDKHIQGFYVRTNIDKGEGKTTIDMHKFLVQTVKGQQVDHISGVTTDNRRNNVRPVTPRGNTLNRKDNQDLIGTAVAGIGYSTQLMMHGNVYRLPVLTSRIHCGFIYDTLCTFLGEEAPKGVTLTDRE